MMTQWKISGWRYVFASALCLSLAGCATPEEKKEKMDKIFDEASKNGPNVPTMESSILESAKRATDKGDHARAAQYYRQLTDKNPAYLADYAEALRRAGQYKAALAMYDAALAKDAANLNAKEGKGLALMSLGDFNNAAKLFGEVMAADAGRWRTINALGIILALNKRVTDSIEYFRAALKISPTNPSILSNVGLALAINEDFPGAIKALDEASRQAAGNLGQKKRVDLNLSLVYGISGNLDMADKTARPHLTSAQLNNNMGVYAALSNNKDLAKSYLNKALSDSPVYYEKAWENLESVQSNDKSGGASRTAPPIPGGQTKTLKVK